MFSGGTKQPLLSSICHTISEPIFGASCDFYFVLPNLCSPQIKTCLTKYLLLLLGFMVTQIQTRDSRETSNKTHG
jgi:hypothetical protein